MQFHTASANGVHAPVPIVNFNKFLTGSDVDRKAAATAIDKALRTDGFVYLSNHGVPQERVDECFKWSKRFFDLPYGEKMKAPHPPGSAHHRGYSGLGAEKVTDMVFDRDELAKIRQAAPDIKESYESGNVTDEMQPNIWPPEEVLFGFREFMESFFEDCKNLTHAVLSCLAISLSLDDPAFISKSHSTSPFQLRLLHYPSVPTALLRDNDAQKRISAHSDFGSITLLFQDAVGGLEIEQPEPAPRGKFRPVEPREDMVLVNVGDLMERWSNGRWKSTVHRVGLPPTANERPGENGENGEETTAARYSIPFFAAPNMDAMIDALPGCYGEGNPKRWDPVSAHDYIQMRMATLY